MRSFILSAIISMFLMSCSGPTDVKISHILPPIYPDYIDVTIPVNVAPLNAERHIESFDERVIADNNLTDGSCMNCHIYGNQNASLSMFHLRGKNGGTILNRDGKLRKINTRGKGMISNARKMGGSACHLKTSPDGKYLLYTIADYGTFPIWHREADLQIMNLKTGEIDRLKKVDGPNSDSYHSWSSNSRWFVFASKRDDGIYGKPYFCYIDSTGKTIKPFVLPQRDPSVYDNTLKSFNIPELAKGPTPYDAKDIERVYWDQEVGQVK